MQEKKLAMAKKSRREIADLLLKDRVETARLRVEGLIGDDIYVELLELLEVGQASVCVGSPGQELISPAVAILGEAAGSVQPPRPVIVGHSLLFAWM